MPPDHNLNCSGEYRSMRWFTPIFPQRIMRHFKFFYSKSTPPTLQFHVNLMISRCLAGKHHPTSQRKSDQRQAPRCAHDFQLATVYTSLNSLKKKWIPPLVDGQLMWTYHTTSVFYDWWPWWFNYIHFNLPKLSEPLTATPFFLPDSCRFTIFSCLNLQWRSSKIRLIPANPSLGQLMLSHFFSK